MTDLSSHQRPSLDDIGLSAGSGAETNKEDLGKEGEALSVALTDLEREKDCRREERFYWMCVVAVVFDSFQFAEMTTWTAPIIIGIIQIAALIGIANKLGVDIVVAALQKTLDKLGLGDK